MKAIAINGSPRKNKNTAILLKNALEGAESQGAETELIHLYDCQFSGCISCFACKLQDGRSYGRCAVKDDLKPILDKIAEADVLLVGSPIYFGLETGETRSFLERLWFQYLVYDKPRSVLTGKKIASGLIYTMNVNEDLMVQVGYEKHFQSNELLMKRFFGYAETLAVTDTYQFEDYSRYETSAFDEAEKAKRQREVFPEDCRKAYALGERLAKTAGEI